MRRSGKDLGRVLAQPSREPPRGGGGLADPLVLYYLATSPFAALDAAAGWPVWVAAFPEGGWRWFHRSQAALPYELESPVRVDRAD